MKNSAADNAFPEAESKQAAASAGGPQASRPGGEPAQGDAASRQGDAAPGQGDGAPDQGEAPLAGSATGKKTAATAADENPFPEEKSVAAAKAAGGRATGGQPIDPDPSGVSSTRNAADGNGVTADIPKQGDVAVAADPKRIIKDVQVGKYYLDSGDYKGAYARFKEASALSHEDPEIAFGLAESARKLNHLDEAVENYKLCLQLDPDGPRAKAAKRALGGFDKLASR